MVPCEYKLVSDKRRETSDMGRGGKIDEQTESVCTFGRRGLQRVDALG